MIKITYDDTERSVGCKYVITDEAFLYDIQDIMHNGFWTDKKGDFGGFTRGSNSNKMISPSRIISVEILPENNDKNKMTIEELKIALNHTSNVDLGDMVEAFERVKLLEMHLLKRCHLTTQNFDCINCAQTDCPIYRGNINVIKEIK
jgi:hypothetical protein